MIKHRCKNIRNVRNSINNMVIKYKAKTNRSVKYRIGPCYTITKNEGKSKRNIKIV